MVEKDPGLAKALAKAYGFAVFPSVGKAALALGCAYGQGYHFSRPMNARELAIKLGFTPTAAVDDSAAADRLAGVGEPHSRRIGTLEAGA